MMNPAGVNHIQGIANMAITRSGPATLVNKQINNINNDEPCSGEPHTGYHKYGYHKDKGRQH